MLSFGESLNTSIRDRITAGFTVDDSAAPPLKPGYAKFKARRGGSNIRDWRLTGRTMRSMRVLKANERRAEIGFTDSETNKRAAINNRRSRQFGVSPKDREMIARVISRARLVRAVSEVA